MAGIAGKSPSIDRCTGVQSVLSHFHKARALMLYRFKSKATHDLVMLEPNGRRVLEIIGKGADTQGIIRPEQMQAAIDALQAAIALDDAARKAATEEARALGDPGAPLEPVSLHQRCVPFIDILRRSMQENKDIVWGV